MPNARELHKKLQQKSKTIKESQAKRKLLNEILDDLYTDRVKIYKMNFVRGIFFGLGTFLGGTIVVTIMVTILSALLNALPFFSDYFTWIIESLQR